jgi:thiamine transport system permease protein
MRYARPTTALGLLVYAAPLAFLGLFFFYPLAEILKLSLAPQGVLDLPALGGLVASEYYLRVAGFTFYQAALSTLLTLAAALPPAYIFAHYDFPGKAVLRALTTVPFVLPAVVVATAFTALLGPTGWVNQLLRALLGSPRAVLDVDNSLGLILLAHVFYNFAIVLRIVGGFWANLDPQLEQAARVLGAGRARALTAVTLPLLAPALLAAALLVFIFDFTSFGVILILGGPRFTTLEVAIYRETFGLGASSLARAAALALAPIAFTFGLTVAYTRLQARVSRPRAAPRAPDAPPCAAPRAPAGGRRAGVHDRAAAHAAGRPRAALRRGRDGDDLRLGLDYYRALFAPLRAASRWSRRLSGHAQLPDVRPELDAARARARAGGGYTLAPVALGELARPHDDAAAHLGGDARAGLPRGA